MPNKNSIESEIDKIVHLCGCGVSNIDPTNDDTIEQIEELEAEATKELLALIQREVKKGRVEELKRLMTIRDKHKFTTYPGQYLIDRLEELENELS